MATDVSEILVSNNSKALDSPAKKQKINHTPSVSCSDGDLVDTNNGTGDGNVLVETPLSTPRELQSASTLNDAVQNPNAVVNVGQNCALDVRENAKNDLSDRDDDFRLPDLRMPQVFDFSSVSYEDRRDGILKILHSGEKGGHYYDVQRTFAYYIEDETAELKGYQAVWRSVDLACDVLVQMDELSREKFPIMMTVEMAEPFCCLPGPSCISATEEQVLSYLKENDFKVNVIELFPVHDDSGDIDEAALVIEHTRFFFNYIWRLSDVSNFMYAVNKFTKRHLEPRLKLYFEVMEKNVSPALALKYQNTITEYQTKYRQLRKKQDYIEKYDEYDCTDTDIDSDTDTDKDIDNGCDRDKEISKNNKDSDKEISKGRCDSEEGDDKKCHGDRVRDSDIRDSDIKDGEAKVQDLGIPMDGVTNLVNMDTDGDKDKNSDRDINDNNPKVHDRDIFMDGDAKCVNVARDGDKRKDSDSDKFSNGEQSSDKDKDLMTDYNRGDDGKNNDNEDSDALQMRFPELEVFEISRLWKNIELLEDTLEMMENPVMRHLMEIPKKGIGHRKNSAIMIQQTRRHNEPVTHIVADKITLGMIQNLRLADDTVLETHSTPASALARCYDNDTILILPGTYSGDGLTDIGQSLTIRGIGCPADVIIIAKCRHPQDDLFVSCYGDRLAISNLTFIDESDSAHFRGLLEVTRGSTQLTNCRFVCGSTGLVVSHGRLDIQDCEISGAQAPGIHSYQGSTLNMISCYIHDCGKTDDEALAEDTCGVCIHSPQKLQRKTSVKISNCKIQCNAGPGILLKIYSTDKHEEGKAIDLGDLCTLTSRDLQVTDNDFSGNAQGAAMVTYFKLKE